MGGLELSLSVCSFKTGLELFIHGNVYNAKRKKSYKLGPKYLSLIENKSPPRIEASGHHHSSILMNKVFGQ